MPKSETRSTVARFFGKCLCCKAIDAAAYLKRDFVQRAMKRALYPIG